MKKKYQELVNVVILMCLYIGIFLFPSYIIESGNLALTIFKEKLFPSIFPFFVLSFLMLNLGISNYISILLEPIIYKIFHIKGNGCFVIMMSIISGFPSGPKYIAKLYQEKQITKEESHYLLLFTHFANPLFILGTCGGLLKNMSLAFQILGCQLLANIIIGILLRPKKQQKEKNNRKEKLKTAIKKQHDPLLIALPDAINQSIEVLLFMLGSVTFFMFISKILSHLLQINSLTEAIITGILDLTSGISLTANLVLSTHTKALLMLTMITFGSFSVHLQVMNALRNTNLNYRYFFIGRIFQTAIAFSLFLLI